MSKGKRPCIYIVRDFLLAYDGSTPEQNVVLLALAAFADPDGSHIFPGTRALTRLTKRTSITGSNSALWS